MPQDSLLYKALNLSKDLDHNGQNSWFSNVRHLCTILNLPADFAKLRKCKFTQLLNSSLRKSCLKLWEMNFKTVMEGKLRTYCKIKTSFGSEKYLFIINNFTLKRAITKLRISSHRLKIETGRYLKLEVNKRLCNKWDLNKIEDEINVLLECPSTSTDRQVLIDMINNNCNNFQYLNLSDNFFWLLNSESIDILKQLGYFLIKTSFLIYM
jgi:hypothetical protein